MNETGGGGKNFLQHKNKRPVETKQHALLDVVLSVGNEEKQNMSFTEKTGKAIQKRLEMNTDK